MGFLLMGFLLTGFRTAFLVGFLKDAFFRTGRFKRVGRFKRLTFVTDPTLLALVAGDEYLFPGFLRLRLGFTIKSAPGISFSFC